MPPAIPGMPPHHPGMPPASCSDASGIIRGRLRDREGMPRASRSTAGGIAAGRVYRPPRANVMEKSPQCHGKVREVARRLGRPFRARGPYWPECQGVALGWRRPHRWRSESAPCGAHQDSTVPPRRHRKKSPKGHSSLWNSLTTNTRNGAKGTSGGCVSPSTELRPEFFQHKKECEPGRGALTANQTVRQGCQRGRSQKRPRGMRKPPAPALRAHPIRSSTPAFRIT